MDLFDKLKILADSAKYDVACTSSGVDRKNGKEGIGSAVSCGICHTFSADGRCVSLLKILMTNVCIYDCAYCVNRRSNDVPRAAFTPKELADLTIQFYRRNYIEGLFLSSGVIKSPDYTCEQLIKAVEILRDEYRFFGYIHAKAIPGADEKLLTRLGMLVDRMSVNIELPSQKSLAALAPDKSKTSILKPMGFITGKLAENKSELVKYRHTPKFAPAGQSTQMIIGATEDTDFQILKLSSALYNKYRLKRVFFSAYMPVSANPLLPAVNTPPPLLREHRLYQADWLLRFYGFEADELLDEQHQSFNPLVDPKCNWALSHMERFPLEVSRAPYEMLLRVPGIGVTSAKRILTARRVSRLSYEGLKKMGVVLKRAQYFITVNGKLNEGLVISQDTALRSLISQQGLDYIRGQAPQQYEQLSLFTDGQIGAEEVRACLTAGA